jgi:hypothetical protein
MNSLYSSALLVLAISACGQDPAFLDVDQGTKKVSSAGLPRSADASGSEESTIDQFDDDDRDDSIVGQIIGKTPTTDDDSSDPDAPGGGGSTGGNSDGQGGGGSGGSTVLDPEDYVIPGVEGDDLVQVQKCLAKWGQVPFPKTINNVRKLVAVSVGGFGNPINDTQQTSEPFLNLVYAGVNVGGTPTYNMMNGNGWYCMLVNVNVATELNINLHCNARLADSLVGVNVGSTMTGDTARIGVHVNSTVTINTIRPQGAECIR